MTHLFLKEIIQLNRLSKTIVSFRDVTCEVHEPFLKDALFKEVVQCAVSIRPHKAIASDRCEIHGSFLDDALEENGHCTSFFSAYLPQTNCKTDIVTRSLGDLLQCLLIIIQLVGIGFTYTLILHIVVWLVGVQVESFRGSHGL